MRVNCDVCGGEPAAVLCSADEAALCSGCDRRVHRANKLAGKHRRIPLLHPDASGSDGSTTGPLCDVCKERRGLVFCVEDRAILCPDCDEPIHSANDLTAKHTRFLLVGAKLGPLPLGGSESDSDTDDVVPAACADSSSTDRSCVLEYGGGGVDDNNKNSNNNGNGGAMISDYLTNICPGWRVDDLLLDDSPFSAATKPSMDKHVPVPSMDADLFDVVAGRSSWARDLRFDEEVPFATATPTMSAAKKQYWNNNMDNDSDVFAVPELTPPPAKKARLPPSFWDF